jgi:surface antigen
MHKTPITWSPPSKRGFKLLFLLALLGGLAAWNTSANAAVFLRGYLSGVPKSWLTADDWRVLQDSAQILLNQVPAVPGQSQDWQGPSGVHGTLIIKRVFAKSDMPCRVVDTHFVNKAGNHSRNYEITVCRIQSGDWKLAD